MNPPEKRLKQIQTQKTIYQERLKNAETELEHDLLTIQINKLNDEEKNILKKK